MYTLIKPFVEVALFRQGPQHLPDSRLLLAVTLLAHALLGFGLFTMRMHGLEALLAGLTGTLLLAMLTASLLFANGRAARTVRTLTALAGTDVVVGVIGLPVSAWLHGATGTGAADGIAGLAFIVLLVWNLAIAGHVLRHALSAPLPMGIVLALIFFIVSITVMHRLFPQAG